MRLTLRKILPVLALAFILMGCADYRTAQLSYKDGDYPTARAHYAPLAQMGMPAAQVQYAQMLLKSQGGPTNDKEARKNLENAFDHHYLPAYPLLAQVYLEGRGGPAYTYRARKILDIALAQGNTKVAADLGKLYYNGTGGPKDLAKAESLYQLSLKNGDKGAAMRLGHIARKQKRFDQAKDYYRLAVKNGEPKAAKQIGLIYEKHVRPTQPGKALAWYYFARRHQVKGLDKRIAKLEKLVGAKEQKHAQRMAAGLNE